MADRSASARFDPIRYDPFGLESPFAQQPESASSWGEGFEPELEAFAQELAEPDLNPFREAPQAARLRRPAAESPFHPGSS